MKKFRRGQKVLMEVIYQGFDETFDECHCVDKISFHLVDGLWVTNKDIRPSVTRAQLRKWARKVEETGHDLKITNELFNELCDLIFGVETTKQKQGKKK